jgi:hypothetical protein
MFFYLVVIEQEIKWLSFDKIKVHGKTSGVDSRDVVWKPAMPAATAAYFSFPDKIFSRRSRFL